jgi:hypothetical protein
MSDEKWIRSEAKEIILYLFIGLLLFVLLPIGAGFIGKGFSEELGGANFNVSSYLGAYLIYVFFGIGALFLIIFPISRLIAGGREDHPANRTNPNWFTMFTISLIHSPEENGALFRMFEYLGMKGKNNPMKWSLSILRCFIISILIFGFLAILQISLPQLNVAGVPNQIQQISPISDIIFGAGIPAFTENGILCLIFFFLLGVDAYLCSKFKLGVGAFFIFGLLIICPLMGVTWMGLHSLIYSASETKLFATFIFGWVGSTITLLTASFSFWITWHFMNNGAIKLAELSVSHQDIIFISIIVWITIFILYIFGEILAYKYRKRHPIDMPIIPT